MIIMYYILIINRSYWCFNNIILTNLNLNTVRLDKYKYMLFQNKYNNNK